MQCRSWEGHGLPAQGCDGLLPAESHPRQGFNSSGRYIIATWHTSCLCSRGCSSARGSTGSCFVNVHGISGLVAVHAHEVCAAQKKRNGIVSADTPALQSIRKCSGGCVWEIKFFYTDSVMASHSKF